jgi:hypothetical protein
VDFIEVGEVDGKKKIKKDIRDEKPITLAISKNEGWLY